MLLRVIMCSLSLIECPKGRMVRHVPKTSEAEEEKISGRRCIIYDRG